MAPKTGAQGIITPSLPSGVATGEAKELFSCSLEPKRCIRSIPKEPDGKRFRGRKQQSEPIQINSELVGSLLWVRLPEEKQTEIVFLLLKPVPMRQFYLYTMRERDQSTSC
ncbi:hypothetical protein AVEN_4153-1 [Araneus ventricosus]|uniref:Uncharacterized protein n=1 Tax=Araneus ventricosus TaxID=182803 RepID=A0A4Y2M2L4_ARAVE|nr:hypothetical protein AVEN_4153-1 [Araneus ventricosus]